MTTSESESDVKAEAVLNSMTIPLAQENEIVQEKLVKSFAGDEQRADKIKEDVKEETLTDTFRVAVPPSPKASRLVKLKTNPPLGKPISKVHFDLQWQGHSVNASLSVTILGNTDSSSSHLLLNLGSESDLEVVDSVNIHYSIQNN